MASLEKAEPVFLAAYSCAGKEYGVGGVEGSGGIGGGKGGGGGVRGRERARAMYANDKTV